MLHFLLISKDTSPYKLYKKIGEICNFKEGNSKKTLIYIPESIWNGYGGEFLPLNIRNFPLRLMGYTKKKYECEPKNFIIIKDVETVKKLLPALHSKGYVGCVIGVLESFMKYVYASKERTEANKHSNTNKKIRKEATKNLRQIPISIASELSTLLFCEDFPVIVLWLGYDYKYVSKGRREKGRKTYLYKQIKAIGKIAWLS